MCKSGPHFKLCTCSSVRPRTNYWKLTRGNKKHETGVVGLIMAPDEMDHRRHFDAAFFVERRLEFDLNNNDVFDFEYLPEEGDKIEFFFEELDTEGFQTEFIFVNGNFKTEDMGEDYRDGKAYVEGDIRYVLK
jgi:hypothetical protein